ncbi:MAG: UDP-N-acetylglucosamine 2-epimerase (hydrolyzing) [Magnetococcales bacterium]|nr:UDP-N-acetylglucosamine 2-epimerase (hydrolyzing) [Magnetococcales bacterium]
MKITLVTTSRADYGLLYPLILQLRQQAGFDTRLVATGGHLSLAQGETIRFIHEDGLPVTPVGEPLVGDGEQAVCQAIAANLAAFSWHFQQHRPDLLVVLGDRYELWSVCIAATVLKIPIAHLHGGETTVGAIDEVIRHSVTKMATFHFASIPLYAHTILQMGENPAHVHVVGALGIDNILNMPRMETGELSAYTGVDFSSGRVALMTYHPVTLDDHAEAGRQVEEVLAALRQTDLFTLITNPNADAGGEAIERVLVSTCQLYPDRFRLVKSLGQRAYLSAMEQARVMIGNSSSGIIESASFHLPVVNIGDRQGGRFKPGNIIDCSCTKEAILVALERALSPDFICVMENPYGDGHAAERIAAILASLDLSDPSSLLKKRFHHWSTTDGMPP